MSERIVRCKGRPDPVPMARPRCTVSAARLREHLRAGRTHAEIAAIEGITLPQVDHRIRQLGLSRPRPLPTAPEILALIEASVARIEIARMFNCSPAAVTQKLKRAEIAA